MRIDHNENLQPRTFYVDVNDLALFKQVSPISISEAVRLMVKQTLDETFDDTSLLIRAEALEKKNEAMTEEANTLRTKLDSLLQQIEENNTTITEIKDRARLIQRTNKLGKLTTTLNKQLVSYHFDVEYIEEMCADIIEEIKSIKPDFDLPSHVDRMKIVLGF
jgi:chromosome segregation ATPase